MEELLKAFGLTFDDITPDEQETLNQWVGAWQQKQMLTLGEVQTYIKSMKNFYASKLADTPDVDYFFFGLFQRPNRENMMYKAQLAVFLMLEGFLSGPQEARKEMEVYLSRIKTMKGR